MTEPSISALPLLRSATNGRFIARNFWEYVEKSPDCWLWIGARHSSKWPYGHFRYQGKTQQAHRVAWILTHGPILPGFLVLHHCDTPACVRPEHLFLGTTSDNARDAIDKGRFRFYQQHTGENSSAAKLTWEHVREIRRLYATGTVSQKRLAEMYHVVQGTIFHIVHNNTWKE